MNCDVTISADDFKTIHNALYELRCLQDRMQTSMIKIQDLERIEQTMRDALADAYDQDNNSFSTKMAHYEEAKVVLGLKSTWSIFEVDCLQGPHPYTGATQVMYKDHWGKEPVIAAIEGPLWVDLYRAADQCIRDSGDAHHCFIEQFVVEEQSPGQLRLATGS
jgi:hypothetical protein